MRLEKELPFHARPDGRPDLDANREEMERWWSVIPVEISEDDRFGIDYSFDETGHDESVFVAVIPFGPKTMEDAMELHRFLVENSENKWMEGAIHSLRYE